MPDSRLRDSEPAQVIVGVAPFQALEEHWFPNACFFSKFDQDHVYVDGGAIKQIVEAHFFALP